MSFLAIVVAIIAIIAIYLIARPRDANKNVRPDLKQKKDTSSNTEFHAVSLRFSAGACNAAKALAGRRFLSTAAPRMPLPECDVLECKCRFTHHKDRREGEDRRNPYGQSFGGATADQFSKDKRGRNDRRADTDDDFV